jgi:organic radical activating enzyme
MRVSATREPGWFWVDWWLLNHCSWHCSYCPELLRSGSIERPNLANSSQFLIELAHHAQGQGLRARVKFTGGEPTEWPNLEQLVSHAANQGIRVTIRTNANVDSHRWSTLVERVTELEMVYHPEHTQTSVYMLNLDRAVKQGLTVRAVFNMLPTRFEETEEVLVRIGNKYPSVSLDRRMLFQDPVQNTQPMNYSLLQTEQLIRQHGDIKIEDGDIITYSDYPTMINDSSNRFQEWQCGIGLEQLIVDAWGRVRRGHCGQGGSMGTIGGEIVWPQKTLRCRRENCANAFDLNATKTS